MIDEHDIDSDGDGIPDEVDPDPNNPDPNAQGATQYAPSPQIQPIVVVIDEAALQNARGAGAGGYGNGAAGQDLDGDGIPDGVGQGYIHPGGDGAGANGGAGTGGSGNDANGDGIPDDATTLNIIHEMQRNLSRTVKKGVNARPYYQPPLPYGLY